MQYYNLRSIVSGGKKPILPRAPSPSFFIAGPSTRPYIEPSFQKVFFETERPTIILVSAVGATGKTVLAEQLSRDVQLPLLNLAKHKPVADNTLTGVLTHAFNVRDISDVIGGLETGAYGVIIDGIDEGRAKTTEQAFEAFLDDIANLCKRDSPTTFLLMGRTQILEDCWAYLSLKGIPTGLITIQPFSLGDARKYIDTFTEVAGTSFGAQYTGARDLILEKLGRVFPGGAPEKPEDFLSFIGYPPVLDAIVTLLRDEKNYHKLSNDLQFSEDRNVEVSLLSRIADYILAREREEKTLPNILTPLLEGAPSPLKERALEGAFSAEEQCIRLVAHCLDRGLSLSCIGEQVLDEQYESRLATWLPEHPFVAGREFRNAVFEAVALATLISSRKTEHLGLLTEYVATHKNSYHLVYMLDVIAKDHFIPLDAVGPLFAAAMEFRSVHSGVELRVAGADWDIEPSEPGTGTEVEVGVEILLGEERKESQVFEFRTDVLPEARLNLGSRLGAAFIAVPCAVQMGGAEELELTAPLEVAANSICLNARALILRREKGKGNTADVSMTARQLDSRVETIATNGVPLVFALTDTRGVSYPASQYVSRAAQAPGDPLLRQKYFRLRRILMEFRSHGKGALAKYRFKIEHERVLKNSIGRAVLNKLVGDRILRLDGNMYFLEPDALSAKVGVSWQDLRRGMMPQSLEDYLRSVPN